MLYGCFNCGSYFLYPEFDEYDEPAYCPECGSRDWTSVDLDEDDFKPEKRGRSVRRKTDFKKAIRKKKIINGYGWDYYSNLHQYSKNKIHCSCPLCRAKTAKRKLKICGPGGKNWTMTDRRKLDELDSQIEELEEFDVLYGDENRNY